MPKAKFGTKTLISLLLLFSMMLGFAACDTLQEKPNSDKYDANFGSGKNGSLTIVSGSENKILEPIIEEYANKENINITIDYLGSLDIMRLLQANVFPYDAVWPASSLWISVGDNQHRVKHLSSTSITPIVFGIRDSLAKKLGFKDKEVYVRDILNAIKDDELRFTMTSATQSNSGASAYVGFLYALLDNPPSIDMKDLQDEDLRKEITDLLSGVERSSGSSNWLVDLFLAGDYDAMVNYEALIISTNQKLEEQNRETLYTVYPVDGPNIADSPLGFVADNGVEGRDQEKQEELFLDLQKYLLSEDAQDEIQKSGRRTGLIGIKPKYEDVFRKDWGIDTNRTLSSVNMPTTDVLMEALNLYQTEFKKPAYNIFLLDFSGSMTGQGHTQLTKALEAIMIEENARQNLLQASSEEINVFYTFSSDAKYVGKAKGNGKDLEELYTKIKRERPWGGTAIYSAVQTALEELENVDINYYSPSIIVMSDGAVTAGINFSELERSYNAAGIDVPVFSILFGDADEEELKSLADLSRARVFDGREDLIGAFQSVRGYN